MNIAKDQKTSRRSSTSTYTQADSAYGGSETMSQRLPQESAVPLQAHRSSHISKVECHRTYDASRHDIARSIVEAVTVACDFKAQATSREWPMQIPSLHARSPRRPTCVRTTTVAAASTLSGSNPVENLRQNLKRHSSAKPSTLPTNDDTSDYPTQAVKPEDTILNVEVERQLQILRPEIMMSAHDGNIIHTMNPEAIAEIMEQQFLKVHHHLEKLLARVEDTSSKVLITGDLNAGKSTLCNALLRNLLLPIDQQPCTEVFTEILDARLNNNRCEVHGMLHETRYDVADSGSYDILDYSDLKTAVTMPERYSSLKVFVHDDRAGNASLLRNDIIDISLIDAPGLNSDSVQTTAVYARQEEIDVVVFVVSAENHFTLSAKEFLWNASNEKAYIFIVVNRFDNIRDKDRCRRLILEQIHKLSPETAQSASELVHFVSAAAVLHGAEDSDMQDFTELETQLRNFVLDRRLRSKLAPAKNFLLKFWADVKAIAEYNTCVAKVQNSNLHAELLATDDRLQQLSRDKNKLLAMIESQNDAIAEDLRKDTKQNIFRASRALSSLTDECKYKGFFESFQYAIQLRDRYLESIFGSVIEAEMQCRTITTHGVDLVRKLSAAHLEPERYTLRPFNSRYMFSRKRDSIQKCLPLNIQISDFLDMSSLEKVVGTSSVSAALILYGGKTLGWTALLETSFRALQIFGIKRTPKLVGSIVLLAVCGLSAYLVSQIPSALQKNLIRKVQDLTDSTAYADLNAHRIAGECRKVLSIPENELRSAFCSKVDVQQRSKSAIQRQLSATTATMEFFSRQNEIIQREEARLDQVLV